MSHRKRVPARLRTPLRAHQPALGLEVLEDRLTPSFSPTNAAPVVAVGGGPLNVTPDHDYQLNDLDDAMGGPALVADGGVFGGGRYVFSANQGLRLTGGLADTGTYSLVLTLRLDVQDEVYYRKLVDFLERGSDEGLYAAGPTLAIVPGEIGLGEYVNGQDFQVALTRSASTGETRMYLNGVLQQVYVGAASDAAVAAGNVLTFFEDDLLTEGAEAATGSVDRILVFHDVLSAADVAALVSGGSGGALNTDVLEGDTATASGTWSDPDGDTVKLKASVGTVVKAADGTWSWSFTPGDGARQSQTVVITATDRHGARSTTSFPLTVHNVAPTITSLSSSHDTLAHPAANGKVTLQGSFSDAGFLDKHIVTVDWGDRSAVQSLNFQQARDTFSGSHRYAGGGIYVVTVTVTDHDGAAASQTTSAVVSGIGLISGTLFVIGTDSADQIDIDLVAGRRKSDPAVMRVQTRLAGQGKAAMSFDPAAVERIVVLASGGDDVVVLAPDVRVPAFLMGGAGNDWLQGGSGPNVLHGGGGWDVLLGRSANDTLVGGAGFDLLFGRRGHDLLIGGTTDDLAVLEAALRAWIAG